MRLHFIDIGSIRYTITFEKELKNNLYNLNLALHHCGTFSECKNQICEGTT